MALHKALADKFRSWRRYFVIAGGILIYLPIGVPWYFGNLATYINSYYHSRVPSETDLVDPQWIFSAFFIAFSLAIIASGYISNRYGPRPTIIAALFVHSGATFLSFYAIQHSMTALILTFGAVGGVGAGLAYGPPLPVVIKWMPRRVGLASGALMTGFGGGAIFYNELVTFFINPDNIRPDVKGSRTTYFSQPELLARIPELFLALGVLTVVLQISGVLLLREPKEGDEIEEVELQEVKPIVLSQQNGDSTPQQTNKAGVVNQGLTADVTSQGLTTTDSAGDNNLSTGTSSTTTDTASAKDVQIEAGNPDLTPLEVLRTPDFYLLWVALAVNHYGYIIKNNYYKEFGQLRISNDHFLTTTGTLATVGVALARLLWGLATDWLGTKLTLLVFMASTSVTTSFWYFSLQHSAALYMLWVCLVSAIFTGAFILLPLAALSSFGEKHYASNYGLILSAQIVVNLISPPIIRQILLQFGWFWLFFSIAAVNVIGTVTLLFLRAR